VGIEVHGAIGPIAEEWDELADRLGASPFLRPGWASAWWTAFGGGRLQVTALRRDDRLVALVPLKRVGRALATTANWHTPEADLLAETEEAARVVADDIFATRSRRIALVFADASSSGLSACRAAAEAAGFRTVLRTRQRSPFVEIQGSFDEFERLLDRSLRTNVHRRRRRLEEEGSVVVDVLVGGEGLDDALHAGFGIEGSGWKTQQGTAIASRPDTLRFYSDVARWAAERGWLQLAFLRLDGKPLAFHFNLKHGGVLYHLKGGYDPSSGRFSPSKLLHHEMLRRAFDEGLASYEFLGAEEGWKREWTEATRERLVLEAFASTPPGVLDWVAHVVGRPAVGRLRSAQRRARIRRRSSV
jgi:CelD/BcsL family acetyltransferase involved in cellulose biosynthesis